MGLVGALCVLPTTTILGILVTFMQHINLPFTVGDSNRFNFNSDALMSIFWSNITNYSKHTEFISWSSWVSGKG